MKVVSLNNVDRIPIEIEGAKGISKQVPVGSKDGAPNFSFRVFTVEVGGNTPYHTHPSEHLNYVITGEGALVNQAGEETPIRKGDFGFVSPGEKHQYRNKGNQPFVMICAVPKNYE